MLVSQLLQQLAQQHSARVFWQDPLHAHWVHKSDAAKVCAFCVGASLWWHREGSVARALGAEDGVAAVTAGGTAHPLAGAWGLPANPGVGRPRRVAAHVVLGPGPAHESGGHVRVLPPCLRPCLLLVRSIMLWVSASVSFLTHGPQEQALSSSTTKS